MQRLKARFEMWSRTIVISLLVLQIRGEELWKKDMTDEVYIEASVEGLKELHLECTKTQMKVKIELGNYAALSPPNKKRPSRNEVNLPQTSL